MLGSYQVRPGYVSVLEPPFLISWIRHCFDYSCKVVGGFSAVEEGPLYLQKNPPAEFSGYGTVFTIYAKSCGIFSTICYPTGDLRKKVRPVKAVSHNLRTHYHIINCV